MRRAQAIPEHQHQSRNSWMQLARAKQSNSPERHTSSIFLKCPSFRLCARSQCKSAAPARKADTVETQFLKLLVAQLKGQNPLDPKDGTEFVSQLAQFSSLEELINIRTTLENFSKTSTTNTASNPFQGA